ncbi:heat shock protein HspQ [Kordiimonas laminariae]|uniref:heat shock protein HspQ n=1 Tax=Kordiimonas laminariae TaxID=2917717 RepID=UPI001FF533C2|nr:heat shock protein HspQ [Kordiimonas laminariae]MCK0070581.1 heat shock protein HspQ [Kordiimonas laminariae]
MEHTETKTARFAPGTIIIHKKYGYRGLIFDVDAVYSQSPEWYESNVPTTTPKDRPWYHVLVDGEPHTTYVAEENLLHFDDAEEFEHPLLSVLFRVNRQGDMASRMIIN